MTLAALFNLMEGPERVMLMDRNRNILEKGYVGVMRDRSKYRTVGVKHIGVAVTNAGKAGNIHTEEEETLEGEGRDLDFNFRDIRMRAYTRIELDIEKDDFEKAGGTT